MDDNDIRGDLALALRALYETVSAFADIERRIGAAANPLWVRGQMEQARLRAERSLETIAPRLADALRREPQA